MRLTIIALAATLAACATHPGNITPQSVSPHWYQAYNCHQLQAERERLDAGIKERHKTLLRYYNRDTALGVAGAFALWPLWFFIGGDSAAEADYSRMQGEHEALRQAWIGKDCTAVLASKNTSEADDD